MPMLASTSATSPPPAVTPYTSVASQLEDAEISANAATSGNKMLTKYVHCRMCVCVYVPKGLVDPVAQVSHANVTVQQTGMMWHNTKNRTHTQCI